MVNIVDSQRNAAFNQLCSYKYNKMLTKYLH